MSLKYNSFFTYGYTSISLRVLELQFNKSALGYTKINILVYILFICVRTIESPNTAIGIEACFLSRSLNFDAPTPLTAADDEESELFCV